MLKSREETRCRDADDIVAEVHSPMKLLDMRARQETNLARGVDDSERKLRHKYAVCLKKIFRNKEYPYKEKQKKASSIKVQYKDFKVKFGIIA